MRLSAIDLNLLVVLDALLREPSVTNAGRRLGLSQSATSHALARLRLLFDDPLFVRTRAGMAPTARALALAAPLRAALAHAEAAIRPSAPFDPATSDARFVLGLDDATQLGTLPELAARLHRSAPHVSLRALAEPPHTLVEALESGRLDLAITVAADLPAGVHVAPLLAFRHVCIVRAGSALAGRRMTLARYLAASHAVIASAESVDLTVDRLLRARGLARRVAVSTSSPSAVPAIVARTDLVATVPDRLLVTVDPALPLVRLAPPLALPPVTVSMLWHERTERDPAQRFLRDAIRALYASAESRRARGAKAR